MSEDELRDWYDASVRYVLAANGAKDDDADGAAALTAAKGVARLVTMARADEFAEYMRAHPDPSDEGIDRDIEDRFSLTATPVPGGLESASNIEDVVTAVVRWVRDVAVFAGIAPDDAVFRLSEWVADGAGDDEPVNPIRLVEAYQVMLSTPESSHAAEVVLGDYGFDRPLTVMERARMDSDIESALTQYVDEHAGLDELAPEHRASAKFIECAAALADEPTVFSSDGDIRTDEYVAVRFHELVGKVNALIDRGAHPGDQSALKAITEFDKAYRDHWGIA